MQKIRRFWVYKKYNDEIWGSLLNKNFSYSKRAVFLSYKRKIFKKFRLSSKFKYYNKGFLQKLRWISFFSKLICSLWKKSFCYNNFLSLPTGSRTGHFKFKNPVFLDFFSNLNLKTLKKYNLKFFLNLNAFPINSKYFSLTTISSARRFLIPNTSRFLTLKKLKLKHHRTFFYSTHLVNPTKKSKKSSLFFFKYIYLKKLSYFFGFKKISGFKNFLRFGRFLSGKNENLLCALLECKLDNFLYRLGFFQTIYFVQKFILGGNVFINNKVIKSNNFFVGLNEMVSFNKRYFRLVFNYLLLKLKLNKLHLNSPGYVEVDYKLLVAIMVQLPAPPFLTNSFSFNSPVNHNTIFR